MVDICSHVHNFDRRQAASKMEKEEEATTLSAPETSATSVAVEATKADAPASDSSRPEKEASRCRTHTEWMIRR